jgi:hypothetical protein
VPKEDRGELDIAIVRNLMSWVSRPGAQPAGQPPAPATDSVWETSLSRAQSDARCVLQTHGDEIVESPTGDARRILAFSEGCGDNAPGDGGSASDGAPPSAGATVALTNLLLEDGRCLSWIPSIHSIRFFALTIVLALAWHI